MTTHTQLWNSHTGESLIPPNDALDISGALFSPDGKGLLTWRGSYVQLWNSDRGQQLTTQPLSHDNPVNGALFSHDGTRILTWSGDKAQLWDGIDGHRLATPELIHGLKILGARFSLDDKQLLTWSTLPSPREEPGFPPRITSGVKVWDSYKGVSAHEVIKHDDGNCIKALSLSHQCRLITEAAFNSDGTRIITKSEGNYYTRGYPGRLIFNSGTGLLVEPGKEWPCSGGFFYFPDNFPDIRRNRVSTRLILITNYSNQPRMEVRGNRNHGFKFTVFGMQMRLRVVIKKHFD